MGIQEKEHSILIHFVKEGASVLKGIKIGV